MVNKNPFLISAISLKGDKLHPFNLFNILNVSPHLHSVHVEFSFDIAPVSRRSHHGDLLRVFHVVLVFEEGRRQSRTRPQGNGN